MSNLEVKKKKVYQKRFSFLMWDQIISRLNIAGHECRKEPPSLPDSLICLCMWLCATALVLCGAKGLTFKCSTPEQINWRREEKRESILSQSITGPRRL